MTPGSKSAPALFGAAATQAIDEKIAALGDWRGRTLAAIREIIRAADPDIFETVKWGRVPVWERDGILTTGEVYKTAVKLTFARGAALKDPKGLFNASLDGAVRRAIDIHEGELIDAGALTALVREAVALNIAIAAAKKIVQAPPQKDESKRA